MTTTSPAVDLSVDRPKKRRWTIAFWILAAVVLAYWPMVGVLLSRMGIRLAEPVVAEKQIEMAGDWFVAWSSASSIGKAVNPSVYPSVVFFRQHRFWPWAPEYLVIGVIADGFDMKTVEICKQEDFLWGRAHFICAHGETVAKSVILDRFGLVATGGDLRSVSAIKAISPTH